jgi:hypothetical protein
MKIAVCTTLAAYVMDNPGTYASWVENQAAVAEHARSVGVELTYFAAIETDARGIVPFIPLISTLTTMQDGDYWTFALDDRRTEITTANRLRHLTMGQNIASEFASAGGYEWMLFLAADTRPPDDVIPKLLEMNHPLVGCELVTYCLRGSRVPQYTEYPVEEQLISAACIMIRHDVFRVIRWRVDHVLGMHDDRSYQYDAQELLGIPSYVRKDCRATHYPEAVCAIETRYPGRDMRVY